MSDRLEYLYVKLRKRGLYRRRDSLGWSHSYMVARDSNYRSPRQVPAPVVNKLTANQRVQTQSPGLAGLCCAGMTARWIADGPQASAALLVGAPRYDG